MCVYIYIITYLFRISTFLFLELKYLADIEVIILESSNMSLVIENILTLKSTAIYLGLFDS